MNNEEYNLMLLKNFLRSLNQNSRLNYNDYEKIIDMLDDFIDIREYKAEKRKSYDEGFEEGYAEAEQVGWKKYENEY